MTLQKEVDTMMKMPHPPPLAGTAGKCPLLNPGHRACSKMPNFEKGKYL